MILFLKISWKILLFAFLALQILVYFYQEHLIFFPEKLPADFPFHFDQPFEEVSIPRDGAVLNALRYRVKNPKGIIVYFHGNAGSLRDWGETGARLSLRGYDVLISDYRGFGKSTGKIRSEAELLGDVRAVLAVAQKEFPDSKIVIFGRSIGSGLALRLASEIKPKALILESPYLSLKSLAFTRFPILFRFILKYPLRSDLFAPKVTAPVFIIHGTDDEIVPVISSVELVKTFATPPTYVQIPGGHHNGLEEFPAYRAWLEKALVS